MGRTPKCTRAPGQARRAAAQSRRLHRKIARESFEAIQAPAPQERYGVTPLATTLKWAKRLLPDSVIDAMIRRRYGITREE